MWILPFAGTYAAFTVLNASVCSECAGLNFCRGYSWVLLYTGCSGSNLRVSQLSAWLLSIQWYTCRPCELAANLLASGRPLSLPPPLRAWCPLSTTHGTCLIPSPVRVRIPGHSARVRFQIPASLSFCLSFDFSCNLWPRNEHMYAGGTRYMGIRFYGLRQKSHTIKISF